MLTSARPSLPTWIDVAQSSITLQYVPDGKPFQHSLVNCSQSKRFIGTCLESFAHRTAFCHGEKADVSARESHSVAVVPIVLHARPGDSISECYLVRHVDVVST